MESKIEIKEAPGDKPKGFMTPLFVGFEFEFDPKTSESDRKIKDYIKSKYGVEYGSKTSGLKQKRIHQDGIDIYLNENLYDKVQLVADFYHDGSVQNEIVTRPVLTEKIAILKEPIFDHIVECGDMWAGGKAGLHMTFLTDHHKELSSFNKVWVRNIIQISRIFYPALVMWNFDSQKRSTRPIGFRRIVSSDVLATFQHSQHYDAISLRFSDTGDIWGVEVRFPDGTNSWAVVEEYTKFWKAIFQLAWDISQKGTLAFSQDIWDYNVAFYQSHRDSGGNIRMTKSNLKLILTKLLAPYMNEPKVRTHYEGWLNWQNKCFAEKNIKEAD